MNTSVTRTHTSRERGGLDRVPSRASLFPTVTPWHSSVETTRHEKKSEPEKKSPEEKVESEILSSEAFNGNSQPNTAHGWQARFRPEPAPWRGDAAELVAWFLSAPVSLPCEPFRLDAGILVSVPDAFYGALTRDIESGPNGPRAIALLDELCRLRGLFPSPYQ